MKQYHLIIFGILIGLLTAGLLFVINRPNLGEPITLSPPPTPTVTPAPRPTNTETPIYVQIKGEINNPGTYQIPENSRLGDLISAAGGLTDNADENFVNNALRISDGDYVFIPAKGQEIPDIARNSSVSAFSEQEVGFQYPLDINQATQEDLESLPGIGTTKAEAIIEYRDMVGSFSKIEDLLEVSGIGPATLEALREYIICEP
jgi:competence protein ComEA